MGVFLTLAAVIVLILAAVLWLICHTMFNMAIVRGKSFDSKSGYKEQLEAHKKEIEAGQTLLDGMRGEDVWITSFDGLRLHGVLYRNGDGKKLLIEAHGFRSSARHDFAAVIPFLIGEGCSLLQIDQRAHGESEGEYITYGVLERRDVRDWVNFAIATLGSDVQIALHGVSMGATTVLLCADLDLPAQVRGIIAASGFVSPYDIFVSILETRYHVGPFPILPLTGLLAKGKAGFGFKDASTLDSLSKCKIPVLLVHGEADDFVPVEMSEANDAACASEHTFIRVSGAGHACSYLVEPDTCNAALHTFFGKIFGF